MQELRAYQADVATVLRNGNTNSYDISVIMEVCHFIYDNSLAQLFLKFINGRDNSHFHKLLGCFSILPAPDLVPGDIVEVSGMIVISLLHFYTIATL